MQNEVQYHLDRKPAKMSALSSSNLGKYEYLIGEDLGLKTITVEQAKFEYSPLGKVFNKELDKDHQKERLLKKLKNTEDHGKKLLAKNSQSLKAIDYFSQLSTKAKELYLKIKKEKNDIDPEKSVCVKTDGTIFKFNKFKNSLDLTSNIYSKMQQMNKTK